MSNIMRWRYGETNPVVLPVDADTVIEIGDLIVLNVDDALPASSIDDIGGGGPANLAAAQEAFHDQFVGVAMQQSRAGDTAPIRVASSGVFEFDCAAATYELGRAVAPNFDGAALASQQVVAVPGSAAHLAIGRVARRVPFNDIRVLIEIKSTILRDDGARRREQQDASS